jgi:F-type H+-transporting ATPase subunit epsilon
MNLKIFLPFEILIQEENVERIAAETKNGSFGILPHRLDCVAALTSGILIYEDQQNKENFVAIDEGILIKTGADVMVSVRRAHKGDDLAKMKQEVEKEFINLDEKEKNTQSVLVKMESSFIHRLAELKHE